MAADDEGKESELVLLLILLLLLLLGAGILKAGSTGSSFGFMIIGRQIEIGK
jgi:uncharacterized membrane protein